MLYLIGLGLNEQGISKEGLLALEKCPKIYLDSYTVDFPYNLNQLRLGKKINVLGREEIESNYLIKEAKGKNIALLVYGCPFFATTHISLVLDAKAQKVDTKIIYSASVFDAISETGLQLYKFGKIISLPSLENTDFLRYLKENLSIKAHSLILIDIGLDFKKALRKLEDCLKKENIKIEKIIVCSRLGTSESKIFYDKTENLLEKEIEKPFCFIIPGEMHFLEEEALARFKNHIS